MRSPRFQHADVSDGLAVIDSLGGPVPPQLLLHRLDEGHVRRDVRCGVLQVLAVAERPQHYEHHRTDRCHVVRTGRPHRSETPDNGEVGQRHIDDRNQPTRGPKLPLPPGVLDDALVDEALGLFLDVEHLHLEAQLRDLAERRREAHARGCEGLRGHEPSI